ncbi:response regulator [Adhaeribacter swui]|uniref:Response regulator n=1 Tax=Adhaeribacter swui TaxID=2086471 RepID=A0A7G7G9D5_9BACT|nr:response regulator [Adhaeribacter swui]QNF33769.1 response regulator [Adhaeribacter swui]
MILIVDDDDTTRYLIKRVIRSVDQKNQILTAGNGEEALSVLNQVCSSNNCPDLVLLDINMPVMNGFEFLQELQNSALSELPMKIAILTTSNNPIDYILAHEYPVVAFLEKPLTEDKFKSIMAA